MTQTVQALLLVFLAEMGDKSQFAAMLLATKYGARRVLLAVFIGAVFLHALAVAVGASLGSLLPKRPIALFGGVLFIAFGLAELRALRTGAPENSDEATSEMPPTPQNPPNTPNPQNTPTPQNPPTQGQRNTQLGLMAIAATFAVSELGDKTQLSVASLASTGAVLPTLIGAVLGMFAADALGVLVGGWLHRRISTRNLRLVAAGGFLLAGILKLATA